MTENNPDKENVCYGCCEGLQRTVKPGRESTAEEGRPANEDVQFEQGS